MKKDNLSLAVFIVIPFIFGAIVEFTSAWVWIPSAIVLGTFWLGAIETIKRS